MKNVFRTIVVAISGCSRTRKVPRTNRRAPLNLENLGDRTLLSLSPVHAIALHPALVLRHPITLPHATRVPNVQSYSFHLNSSNGSPAHTLVVKTETFNWFSGSASFTGTWKGDGPNAKTVSGTMVFAPNSHSVVNVNFSWTNGNNGQNSFSGTMTPVHNRITVLSSGYFLSGTVTSSTGGGPGMVSGYGYPPRLVLKGNF